MRYALLLLAAGCASAGATPLSEFEKEQARAAFALAQAQSDEGGLDSVDPVPGPDDEQIACNCGGSGKSGDGLAPCPCLANGTSCPCAHEGGEELAQTFESVESYTDEPIIEPPPIDPPIDPELFEFDIEAYVADLPSPCVIYFHSPACRYCPQAVERVVKPLRAAGWTVHEVNHAETPDITDAFGVEGFPAFVGISKGEILAGDDQQIAVVYVWDSFWPVTELFGFARPDVRAAPQPTRAGRLSAAEIRQRLAGYNGRAWYVRGQSYAQHLIRDHGFTQQQIAGLNQQQLFRLHGAAHEGAISPYGGSRQPAAATNRQPVVTPQSSSQNRAVPTTRPQTDCPSCRKPTRRYRRSRR